MKKPTNIDKLQNSYRKLTEANQHFVLGLAEGLKHAQGKVKKIDKKYAVNFINKDGKEIL